MRKLKCGQCGYEYKKEVVGSYPCGPCPTSCPNCGEGICPFCGDNTFGVESSNEDIVNYCGNGCKCGWEHCGGCI